MCCYQRTCVVERQEKGVRSSVEMAALYRFWQTYLEHLKDKKNAGLLVRVAFYARQHICYRAYFAIARPSVCPQWRI